jgi:hypothetical protein
VKEIQRPPPIVGVEGECPKHSVRVKWEGNGGGGGVGWERNGGGGGVGWEGNGGGGGAGWEGNGGGGGAGGEVTAELGKETALEHQYWDVCFRVAFVELKPDPRENRTREK